MRTSDEIVFRILLLEGADLLEFESSVLVGFLPENRLMDVSLSLKKEATWEHTPPTEEAVKKAMRAYFDFAMQKCKGERGISASRSISHYRAWVWLLKDEEALAFLNNMCNYPEYGRPMLEYLNERFGFSKEETDGQE